MKKVIKLKESELKSIVNQVIVEALGGDPSIMAIQTALKAAGYGNLLGTTGPNGDGVDGVYGRNTKAAISAYQKANGIKQTGFVGTVTAPKLGVQPMTGKSQTGKTTGKTSGGGVDPNLFKKAGLGGGNAARKDNTDGSSFWDRAMRTAKGVVIGDTTVPNTANKNIVKMMPLNKINPRKGGVLMKAPNGNTECAKFVNDFSDKTDFVGNAWDAHNNDRLGKRKWSAFTNLNPKTIKKVETQWLQINKAGGGKKDGPYNDDVRQLINTIVPQTPPVKLQLDDIVGIYYPPSDHHEEAFYNAGKAYFTDVNGKMTPGKTIESGQGWGMNTHLGIVGAIKDGVPIIFHNVHGTVFADPPNNIYNGGRVAWVKA